MLWSPGRKPQTEIVRKTGLWSGIGVEKAGYETRPNTRDYCGALAEKIQENPTDSENEARKMSENCMPKQIYTSLFFVFTPTMGR